MKDKVKYIVIIVMFATILGGFFFGNLLAPDKDISYSERRPLEQFPDINMKDILDVDFMEDFDKYALDQFVFRDTWRSIKAFWLYNVFGQMDNNGVYVVDGNVSKVQYPLNEKSIINGAKKFNSLMQEYFPNNNVFYSVIPDKNYYIAEENGYIDLDHDRLLELLQEGMGEDATFVNIFDSLDEDDYYMTDIHWSQDEILEVANTLAKAMGVYDEIKDVKYAENIIEGFKGVYGGQYPLPLDPEDLVYLTSTGMDNWIVKKLDEKKPIVPIDETDLTLGQKLNLVDTTVYAEDRFDGTDPYDVFLHGANPIITIENGNNPDGKELFIFRDSFSSSLSPLLVEGYSKVTLIDLRYITADIMGEYIDFGENNDVLFLYGTAVLNDTSILKA